MVNPLLLNTIGNRPWLRRCIEHGLQGTYHIYTYYFGRESAGEDMVTRSHFVTLQRAHWALTLKQQGYTS